MARWKIGSVRGRFFDTTTFHKATDNTKAVVQDIVITHARFLAHPRVYTLRTTPEKPVQSNFKVEGDRGTENDGKKHTYNSLLRTWLPPSTAICITQAQTYYLQIVEKKNQAVNE